MSLILQSQNWLLPASVDSWSKPPAWAALSRRKQRRDTLLGAAGNEIQAKGVLTVDSPTQRRCPPQGVTSTGFTPGSALVQGLSSELGLLYS